MESTWLYTDDDFSKYFAPAPESSTPSSVAREFLPHRERKSADDFSAISEVRHLHSGLKTVLGDNHSLTVFAYDAISHLYQTIKVWRPVAELPKGLYECIHSKLFPL